MLWHKLIKLLGSNRLSPCVKSVRSRSYFGPYFPAFGLNTERYSHCGKIRTRITPNTDTFHAVILFQRFFFSVGYIFKTQCFLITHNLLSFFICSWSWTTSKLFPSINSLLSDIWLEFFCPICNAYWDESSALLINRENSIHHDNFYFLFLPSWYNPLSTLNLLSIRFLISNRLLISWCVYCVDVDMWVLFGSFLEPFLSFCGE